MGNKHPLSLKLKKQKRWISILYKYAGPMSERNKHKIINKIIIHKYKGRLISKPIYEYTSKGINVLMYEFWREMRIKWWKKEEVLEDLIEEATKGWGNEDTKQMVRRNMEIYVDTPIEVRREEEINNERKGRKWIEKWVQEQMGTQIKIYLRRLKGIVLDSKIVGEYLGARLKQNSVNRARWKLREKTYIRCKKEEDKVDKDQYKWTEIKEKDMNNSIGSCIYGISVEIKGRFSKKRRIRRSMKKRLRIGRLEYNTISGIIDYNQIQAIGVQGVYNIRVGMST